MPKNKYFRGTEYGPKGDKGDTGTGAGDKGDTGVAGSKGDTGITGGRGDTGVSGAVGATGATGAKGDTGVKGDTGTPGSTGATGATGAKGDKGDTGVTGGKGDTGTPGATGATGPKGDTGSPGGLNTQVQFNDSGVLNGDSGLIYNKSTQKLTVGNVSLTHAGQIDASAVVATTGLGIYLTNDSTGSAPYTVNVGSGQVLDLIYLNFYNSHNVNQEGAYNGIKVITEADAVDISAGIDITNNGGSDALHIGVRGKQSLGSQNLPTGIGIDFNKGTGLTEGGNNNLGYGIQVWDWSTTDSGVDAPAMLYLNKRLNVDTHHVLALLNANRNAMRFIVPQGGDYTGVEPLIDILGGGAAAQRFVVSASGKLGVGPNVPSLDIESHDKIGIRVPSPGNNVSVYFDAPASGTGRIVSQDGSLASNGRILAISTLTNLLETARFTNAGLFGLGYNAPSYKADIFGATRVRGGLYIDTIDKPTSLTVVANGATGAATWGYKITAVSALGETDATTEVTISNGNATLNSSNFNRITWTPGTSGTLPEKFKIYRTTSGGTPSSTGLLATITAPTLTYDDIGGAASGSVPTLNTTGNVGIGVSTITASLHLRAGTATANTAPLKFTSGTLLATPEAGAMEYDGSHIYGTIGSTRYQIDQQARNYATYIVAAANSTDLHADYLCDGTADEVQINAAIAAAYAAGGGYVLLKEGLYTIAASVTPMSNVIIVGSGYMNTTIKKVASGSFDGITATGISNFGLRDFKLDGNKTNSALGRGINFATSSNGLIERVFCTDAVEGFKTDTCTDITWAYCIGDGNYEWNFYQYSGTRVKVLHSKSLNAKAGSFEGFGMAFYKDCNFCEAIDNYVYNSAHNGLQINAGSAAADCYGNIFRDNVVENAGHYGIFVTDDNNSFHQKEISLVNNRVTGSTLIGIYLIHVFQGSISGNKSYANTTDGITIEDSVDIISTGNQSYGNNVGWRTIGGANNGTIYSQGDIITGNSTQYASSSSPRLVLLGPDDINLNGEANRTIKVNRTIGGTSGNNLVVQAGGAVSGGTNQGGGSLTLSGGISTGSGGSRINLNVAPDGQTSGTTDHDPSSQVVMVLSAHTTNLRARLSLGTGSLGIADGITLGGQFAYQVAMIRETTSNTAGNDLTLQSGGATIGATDKAAGSLVLQTGLSTGSGTSQIVLKTADIGSTGTDDNALTTRMTIDAAAVTLLGYGGNEAILTGVGSADSNGLRILGGDADFGSDNQGGLISIRAGSSDGVNDGPDVDLTGGDAGTEGNGGTVTLTGGSGGSSNGRGGHVRFWGGNPSSGTDNDGGNVYIESGEKDGSGANGKIMMRESHSGPYSIFDLSAITTSDKTFTFPDASGTIALTSDIANQVTAASTFGTDNSILRADGTLRGAQSSGSVSVIDDSGRLGLGTASPSELLHLVKATGNFTTVRFDSGTTQGYFFAYDGDNSVNIGANSNSVVNIRVNNSSVAQFTAGGSKTGILDFSSVATSDKTFTFPNVSGTLITTGNLTSITTVGTIAAGVWNGTAIDHAYLTGIVQADVGGLTTASSPTFTGLTLSGNQTTAGYLRVGSNSAPANTTAGDITGVRIFVGNGAAVGTGNIVKIDGANVANGITGMLTLQSTDSHATDKGASIVLGGYITSATTFEGFAGIAGRKENSNSGNTRGYLQLSTNGSERMRIDSNGKVGIGTTGSSGLMNNDLSMSGQAAKSWGLERHTTSDTAGNNLTIKSGGATSAATNKSAGSLILQTGLSTGSGTGQIRLQATLNTAASTTDNALVTRMIVNGTVALTSGVAATIATPTIAAGQMAGGIVMYSIVESDGTDMIVESGQVAFSLVLKSTTYTSGTSILGTVTTAKSDGTDTIATTFAFDATNHLQVTCTITGNTPSSFKIIYTVVSHALQDITAP